MDRDMNTSRKKKSDKAREKYEKTGGFSQKHVRISEALAAASLEKAAAKRQSKS